MAGGRRHVKGVDPGESERAAGDALAHLAALVTTLRGPDGCPWDRAQTRDSVTPYLVEETYEVVDAIRMDDPESLREELGDLLFQVLFHADMSRQAGSFDLTGVIDAIHEKMVRRHPHVFGDAVADTPEEVLRNWDALKAKEPSKQGRQSVLDGVPRSLPSLLRAHQIGKRAARSGFDWAHADAVWPKVHEELDELKAGIAAGDRAAVEAELGDLIFTLVHLGRKLGVSAEAGVTGTIARFTARFQHMEGHAEGPLKDLGPDRLEALWCAAKEAVG